MRRHREHRRGDAQLIHLLERYLRRPFGEIAELGGADGFEHDRRRKVAVHIDSSGVGVDGTLRRKSCRQAERRLAQCRQKLTAGSIGNLETSDLLLIAIGIY